MINDKIKPEDILYIKLGKKGLYEKECIKQKKL